MTRCRPGSFLATALGSKGTSRRTPATIKQRAQEEPEPAADAARDRARRSGDSEHDQDDGERLARPPERSHAARFPATTATAPARSAARSRPSAPKIGVPRLDLRARRSEDDQLGAHGAPPPRRSPARRSARARAGRSTPRRTSRAAPAPRRASRRPPPRSGRSASSARSSGTSSTCRMTIRDPRSEASRAAATSASSDSAVRSDRDEDRAVLDLERRAEHDRGRADGLAQRHVDAAGGRACRRRSRSRASRGPTQPRRLLLDDDHDPREPRCRGPPRIANSGQSIPPSLRFGRARYTSSSSGSLTRSATTAAWAIVNESIAPKAYIVPEELRLARQDHQRSRRIPRRRRATSHGVLNRGCSRRKTSGSCR